MKQEYIEAITNLLNHCNDISILDFIYQLLKKVCGKVTLAEITFTDPGHKETLYHTKESNFI